MPTYLEVDGNTWEVVGDRSADKLRVELEYAIAEDRWASVDVKNDHGTKYKLTVNGGEISTFAVYETDTQQPSRSGYVW